MSETWDGITQFNLIQDIVANIDDGALDKVADALKQIAQVVLNKNVMRVALNTEEKSMDANKKKLSNFFDTLPARSQTPGNVRTISRIKSLIWQQTQLGKQSDFPSRQFYFSIPASINFVAQCFPTVTYAHPDFAKLQVLSTMMSQSFLHREIREKGGAYGGGAGQSSGLFYFYSYRDPNTDKTINSFQGAVDWVLNGQEKSFTEQVRMILLEILVLIPWSRTLKKLNCLYSPILICRCLLPRKALVNSWLESIGRCDKSKTLDQS